MQSQNIQALSSGCKLQDYQIDQPLSGGGFSFVYLAHDKHGEIVAIKEYLPATLAVRADDSRVHAASDETLSSFRYGLKCFFEEGRTLAKIDHRNIVRVLNFFRANDTVYMVMRYERGKSLLEYIQSHPEPVKEKSVRRIFSELLNGLREVHAHKLLHLDIKPANIYIRHDGSPVLLDFGSARQTLTNAQPKLPPSYTPGFAPPEQYFDRKHLGPWSDIYSVGATMYACLSQAAPVAADSRVKQDTLVPAIKLGHDIYSERLLEIIDWCMVLDHRKRPLSVFSLQKALREEIPQQPKKKSLLGALWQKFNRANST